MPEKEGFFDNPESAVPNEQEVSAEEKTEKYKDLLGESQAIFILAADIREVGEAKAKKYRPDSYWGTDEHGFMAGGHARVIAAAEIGHYFPDVKLVATSFAREKDISLAKIYANELKNLGIPEEQVELEENSTNTLSELIEMIKMAKNRNWKNLAILTSDYHIPRTQEMLVKIENLASISGLDDKEFREAWDHFAKGKKIDVRFLSAEEVLPLRSRRYKKIIESVRQTEAYRKRVEAEQKGLQQLKDGSYGKK